MDSGYLQSLIKKISGPDTLKQGLVSLLPNLGKNLQNGLAKEIVVNDSEGSLKYIYDSWKLDALIDEQIGDIL
jgi:hypothetical protein